MNKIAIIEKDYSEILLRAVAVIESNRATAARTINTAAINTYWEIGKLLHERKLESAYGNAIVKRLSVDLKERYPDMGTSTRNLWYMKRFYERYKDCGVKMQRSVAVLPWKHNLLLINKELDNDAILYYANEDISKGWNADLLLNAIKLKMHKKALPTVNNNFDKTMPTAQSAYANEVFRDVYNLGFLDVTEPIAELDLERRLVKKIKLFLLELGKGFTFIGNQHELEYAGKSSRVDLLFFHRGLRCLVAIDLKIGEFHPEYAGKMSYYLSLLDRLEKYHDENPSIGIILCAEKDHVQVELTLEGITKPIGVADYHLIIPKEQLQQTIAAEIKAFESEKRNSDND